MFVHIPFFLFFFASESMEDSTRHFLTYMFIVNTLIEGSLVRVANEEGLAFTRLKLHLIASS